MDTEDLSSGLTFLREKDTRRRLVEVDATP